MAKATQENIAAAFQRYLQPGEQIRAVGFGLKQPPLILMILCFGGLLGWLLTKFYVVALTDRRFVALQVPGGFFTPLGDLNAVKAVHEYHLGQLSQFKVKTSTGPLFTHIAIEGGPNPFVAKFHRMGMKGQRETMMGITQTLEQAAAAGAMGGGAPGMLPR